MRSAPSRPVDRSPTRRNQRRQHGTDVRRLPSPTSRAQPHTVPRWFGSLEDSPGHTRRNPGPRAHNKTPELTTEIRRSYRSDPVTGKINKTAQRPSQRVNWPARTVTTSIELGARKNQTNNTSIEDGPNRSVPSVRRRGGDYSSSAKRSMIGMIAERSSDPSGSRPAAPRFGPNQT